MREKEEGERKCVSKKKEDGESELERKDDRIRTNIKMKGE